jgi:GAF domain-containing protein
MTDDSILRTAISVAILDAEQEHRRLLQSIVEVARAIFGAAASSIFLLDEAADELVFEAVAGEGEEFLVGRRFPASRGIAGWVLAAGQPLVLDDLAANPRFAHDIAESTRYVPQALMAIPLICDEQPLGVLEVLDRAACGRALLDEMDLLELFARQAAAALRIVQRSRVARRLFLDTGHGAADGTTDVVAVARMLDGAEPGRRSAGLHLLQSMRSLLDGATSNSDR